MAPGRAESPAIPPAARPKGTRWATSYAPSSPNAVRAVELILDRIDGKVSIPIEVSQVTMLIDPEDDVQ
jgi:hypothetical protein